MTGVLLPDIDGVSLAVHPVGAAGEPVPECDLLPPRATEERRATFEAGRRAARAALRQLIGGPPPRVDPDRWGKPTVPIDGVELSITHAGGWALAAAGRAPLGVDLVEIEPLPPGFDADVFAPEELHAWSPVIENSMMARCIAFGAKEAALKWLGIGMRVPLPSVWVLPSSLAGEPVRTGGATLRQAEDRVELVLTVWPLLRAATPLYAVMLCVGPTQ